MYALLLSAVTIQSSAQSVFSLPDMDEKEKYESEYPHFLEGLPPGVTEEETENTLTLRFHKPHDNVNVEIYNNGVLVTVDNRKVNDKERVSYTLPGNDDGKRLVLIKCDNGNVYGNNY